jgi:hypothetical protein
MLSNLLQSIHLFRCDAGYEQVFILAGEGDSLEIVIFKNGNWEFANYAEF